MEREASCYGRFNGCWNFVQGSCCSVLHGVVTFRESNEKSYQLLRDSLDLYLTINPDNVQYLLLQARLYFHLGIWPEKVQDAKTLWFPPSSKLTIVWIYAIVCCVWSSCRRSSTSCSTFRPWTPPSMEQWVTWCSILWSTFSTKNIPPHPR